MIPWRDRTRDLPPTYLRVSDRTAMPCSGLVASGPVYEWCTWHRATCRDIRECVRARTAHALLSQLLARWHGELAQLSPDVYLLCTRVLVHLRRRSRWGRLLTLTTRAAHDLAPFAERDEGGEGWREALAPLWGAAAIVEAALLRRLRLFTASRVGRCCERLRVATETLAVPPPTLGSFTLLRRMGRGSFGVVYAARREDTLGLFALKLLCRDGRGRDRATKDGGARADGGSRADGGASANGGCPLLNGGEPAHWRHLRTERHMLLAAAHARSPFLCPLRYAFMTPRYACLVMPLYAGGTLAARIDERGSASAGA